MMDGRGKSDRPTVPGKLPNKAPERAAEAVEGKGLAKGNSPERNVLRTQSRESAPSELERVRQAARRDRKQRFTTLLHHVYEIDRLRTAYHGLKRNTAGVNGETWRAYGDNLEANLRDLADRLKRGGVPGEAGSSSVHPEGGRAAATARRFLRWKTNSSSVPSSRS